ncbi:MAG: ribosome silencing factor [Candidatus Omnitrophota bacterium]
MTIEARKKLHFATKIAREKKAEDLVALDMRKIANFCDYFVICSGNSQKQVEGIADAIEEAFLKNRIKTANSNGTRNGLWALLDYGDLIVHVFFKEIREYYNLERLWIDAQRIRIPKG